MSSSRPAWPAKRTRPATPSSSARERSPPPPRSSQPPRQSGAPPAPRPPPPGAGDVARGLGRQVRERLDRRLDPLARVEAPDIEQPPPPRPLGRGFEEDGVEPPVRHPPP